MTKKLDHRELVYSDGYGRASTALMHDRAILSRRALFAMHMMERWAPIVSTPAGEDSAGRAQYISMPVKDVVQRCVELADLAYDEFEARGWFTEVPPYEEVKRHEEGQ